MRGKVPHITVLRILLLWSNRTHLLLCSVPQLTMSNRENWPHALHSWVLSRGPLGLSYTYYGHLLLLIPQHPFLNRIFLFTSALQRSSLLIVCVCVGGSLLLKPICFKVRYVAHSRMLFCSLWLQIVVMWIIVAFLSSWTNLAIVMWLASSRKDVCLLCIDFFFSHHSA